jgi:hypothetical protein
MIHGIDHHSLSNGRVSTSHEPDLCHVGTDTIWAASFYTALIMICTWVKIMLFTWCRSCFYMGLGHNCYMGLYRDCYMGPDHGLFAHHMYE